MKPILSHLFGFNADAQTHALNRSLRLAALIGIPFYLAATFTALQRQSPVLLWVYTLVFACLLAVTFLRRLPYRLRANLYLFVLFTLGLFELLQSGLSGMGPAFLLAYFVLSVYFTGLGGGAVALILNVLTLLLVGVGMAAGRIAVPPDSFLPNASRLLDWLSGLLTFGALAVLIGDPFLVFFHHLEDSAAQQQKKETDSLTIQQHLEERFEQKASDYQRWTEENEAAVKIATAIAAETDPEKLLEFSCEQLQTRFGFDYAGIYLLDKNGETADRKAACGGDIQSMPAQEISLHTGTGRMVGYSLETGQVRLAPAAGEDVALWRKTCLPGTETQCVLPLAVEGRVIGAVDIQSKQPGAIDSHKLTILEGLANVLALAIGKNGLAHQLKAVSEELETSTRRLTYQSWQSHLGANGQVRAYRYKDGVIESIDDKRFKAAEFAQDGEPVIQPGSQDQSEGESSVAVPIRLRGQVLGVLNIRFNSPSVPAEMIRLIQSTTDRMALSLETARLLEEVQVRAEREHMVSEISAKVRAASDMENVLRTTALELGRSLGLSDITVQLRPKDVN